MKNRNRFSRTVAGIVAMAAMCASLPVMEIGASAAQTLAGDTTKDDTVSVADVILLQQYLTRKATFDQQSYENADMNADGKVNIIDLALLKKSIIDAREAEQPTDPQPSEPTTSEGLVTSIVFEDTSVKLYDAEGNAVTEATNVTVENGTYVTITSALPADAETGKVPAYSISGSSSNGQIKVSTDNTVDPTAAVELSLEGLTLSNDSVAPIFIDNVGDSATLTVKKGTENTISDGTTHTDTYVNSDNETVTVNGAIYSKDDLKIKGKGTLTVNGNYADGIVCKDDLKIWNGTVVVNAVDDGIRGNDSVRIGDPDDMEINGGKGDFSGLNISVTTKSGDGIKSTNSTDTTKGFVTINGGTVNINSYADGIQAEQQFTMNGGDVTIYTYQGSGYTGSGSSSGSTDPWSGGFGGGGMGQDGNSNKTDISAKGIKAVGLYDEAGTTWQSAGNITITGGTLNVDSSDDCVHCGGDMNITGGNFTIASADDGFHSDHNLTIGTANAGTFDDVVINITKCYEGVEAPTINQNSGTVYIVSEDDGYNAGGGADSSGTGGFGGPGSGWGQGTTSGSTSIVMNLNGGLVVVNSANGDHDAFDSNGDIIVNGGYYCANGQEPMDCGDSGNSISMNGGSVVSMTAGNTSLTTRYTFTDSNGNAIVSFLSGNGGGLRTGSTVSAQSGGNVEGGTEILSGNVIVGGTLSGGSALGQASESGMGGPGGRW